ncbi:putative elongation of fatty acids protein [Porphyridium purpureum]|uniref:Elongation of fatty acids protein n=1 Tax=Porphyridium purpureum TaxID=35688 RepID=A0A5J4YUA5_PORPP|nr:putative elongation of fatty acids protein [Porphyridium purpureum]|eukprot:POR6584..scf227_4
MGWAGALSALREPITRTFGELRWESAPLASPHTPVLGVVLYLGVIFGLQRIMRDRAPFKLRYATVVHNAFLCALSAAMCIGTLLALAFRVASLDDGFMCIVCDRQEHAMTGDLLWWMYIFYASKYYEVLDTVIMVLKKKPLNFLHVYHHAVVMCLFWAYMQSNMVIHWILIVANSFVHVLMYYYYGMSAMYPGIKIWWKKYITMIQIVQFVVDLTSTWPFPFLYFSSLGCRGSMRGWVFGQLVGMSFFKLFSDLYRKNYKGDSASKQKQLS